MTRLLPLLFLVSGGLAIADDAADRAKLIGTWQSQDHSGPTWVVQSSGQDLHLTQMQNDQKLADFECNTVGRECEAKGASHGLKVSMWYSGPRLVVLETHGSDVVKHRFHALEGDKLELEVIPIVPEGKTQMLNLVRLPQTASTNQ